MSVLDGLVAEAFVNAAENGYDFCGWTDEAIAIDMATCDGNIEHYLLDEIIMSVIKCRPVLTPLQ